MCLLMYVKPGTQRVCINCLELERYKVLFLFHNLPSVSPFPVRNISANLVCKDVVDKQSWLIKTTWWEF